MKHDKTSTPQAASLNVPAWLKLLAEEQADTDKLTEQRALQDYKLITSTEERSFSGWRAYKIRHGLPFLPTDIEEPRFWEIMEEKAGKAAVAPRTEEEHLAAIKKNRAWLLKHYEGAIKEAREKGWLVGWKWLDKPGGAPPLFQWLIEKGITKKRPSSGNIERWNIEDGTFEDKAGNPKTKASLSASKAYYNPQ